MRYSYNTRYGFHANGNYKKTLDDNIKHAKRYFGQNGQLACKCN